MAKLFLNLRNVPGDEADDVRDLLRANAIDFYETQPSPWGISAGGLWIEDVDQVRQSTLDLVAGTRFALIAGEDGSAWCDAARAVAAELGVDLTAVTVGHVRGDRRDPRLRWERVREIGPRGAILVRPDRCVAFRSLDAVDDPADALRSALAQVLGRTPR